MPTSSPDKFPVAQLFDEVERLLPFKHLVIQAPPGAGKSTVLPMFLLEHGFASKGRIIMLQPRRVAALNIAQFLAKQLGEVVGQRVGYQIRQDKCWNDKTELVVVTEGIFTRWIQSEPELLKTSIVIFDEFHERNLQLEMGLAFALESLALRSDLRFILMSATLPASQVSQWLTGLGVDNESLTSTGKVFPIETYYRPPKNLTRWLDDVPNVVREAIKTASHGVLVFLPGMREIRRVANRLQAELSCPVDILHGSLPVKEQKKVLESNQYSEMRVVLSTNLAETSVTIPGIDVVVDSGRERVASYQPQIAMTRLTTQFISQASAEQRKGRAGRVASGVCFRLWSESHSERLPQFSQPPIETQDLSTLVIECLQWGAQPASLAWFTEPSPVLINAAFELLQKHGCVRYIEKLGQYSFTDKGVWISRLNTEPRFAMCLYAARGSVQQWANVSWFIAVLELNEVQITGPEAIETLGKAWEQRAKFKQTLNRFNFLMTLNSDVMRDIAPNYPNVKAFKQCVLGGFADRVAKQEKDYFVLATGKGAKTYAQSNTEFLIALDASLDSAKSEASIHRYLPVEKSELLNVHSDWKYERDIGKWMGDKGSLCLFTETHWGKLVLKSGRSEKSITQEVLSLALARWVASQGWSVTGFSEQTESLIARLRFAGVATHANESAFLPCPADELLAKIALWASSWLNTFSTRGQLSAWKPEISLWQRLNYQEQKSVQSCAPESWQAPSGKLCKVDYRDGAGPKVSVRVQEIFGLASNPRLSANTSLMLELLSPAYRPIHRTKDISSFWQDAWHHVRKEMKGRYPKHVWPEDPISTEASSLTKKALVNKKHK